MFERIIACLDGSSLAEKILPLVGGLTAQRRGRLTLLRIVPEADQIAGAEESLRDCARRYGAALRFHISSDPAGAIVAELARDPQAIAALTTHGRTAWAEAILGNVGFRIIRETKRPVIVFCPLGDAGEAPAKITAIAVALDGTRFSEKIIPYASKAARFLSARLTLIQVLPTQAKMTGLAEHEKSDVLESAYLHRKAADIKSAHGIDPQWEVLHGDPSEAICRYFIGASETMLAMTTHARGGLDRVVLGSVAGTCVRRSGIPLLLYWPHP